MLQFNRYRCVMCVNTLTFLFLWAFLRLLVVTDIDSITKNWKHTKLILLLRAHDNFVCLIVTLLKHQCVVIIKVFNYNSSIAGMLSHRSPANDFTRK